MYWDKIGAQKDGWLIEFVDRLHGEQLNFKKTKGNWANNDCIVGGIMGNDFVMIWSREWMVGVEWKKRS